jgi:hypothetical protein
VLNISRTWPWKDAFLTSHPVPATRKGAPPGAVEPAFRQRTEQISRRHTDAITESAHCTLLSEASKLSGRPRCAVIGPRPSTAGT